MWNRRQIWIITQDEMLYLLQSLFINNWGVLRIFKSITIRASIAFIIAFVFMLIFGKPFIKWLKKKKIWGYCKGRRTPVAFQ